VDGPALKSEEIAASHPLLRVKRPCGYAAGAL